MPRSATGTPPRRRAALPTSMPRPTTAVRVHFPTLVPCGHPTPVTELRRIAAIDERGEHELVDDPDSADAIVFTEAHLFQSDWRRQRFRDHPLVQRHGARCFAYDETDRPWTWLPGLFVSMPARYLRPSLHAAWKYHLVDRGVVPGRGEHVPDLLFSFVGSAATHPCRRDILALRHPDAYMEDTSGFLFHAAPSEESAQRRSSYRQLLARSKYVLCPRGHGTATLRLFEVLAAGRVPVIISDGWVPPQGPDWSAISIRWPESRVAELPHMLERRDDWEEMAGAAAHAYDLWFGEKVFFHRTMEALRLLVTNLDRKRPPSPPLDGAFRRVAAARALDHLKQLGKPTSSVMPMASRGVV